MKTFEQIAELERRYLLGTYDRYPIVLTRGKGVVLYESIDLDSVFVGLKSTLEITATTVVL